MAIMVGATRPAGTSGASHGLQEVGREEVEVQPPVEVEVQYM